MNCRLVALLFIFGLSLSTASAQSGVTLISDEEAKLPPPKIVPHDTRGITRGPKIEVVTPAGEFKSPGPIKLSFQTYGGVNIDVNSVRVAYLRASDVDVTERLNPFVSGSGINLPAATVPAGKHVLRFEIKDVNGRAASKIVTLETGDAR